MFYFEIHICVSKVVAGELLKINITLSIILTVSALVVSIFVLLIFQCVNIQIIIYKYIYVFCVSTYQPQCA